jgi:hypothetical protein
LDVGADLAEVVEVLSPPREPNQDAARADHHHDEQTMRESEHWVPIRLDAHDWPRAGVEVF